MTVGTIFILTALTVGGFVIGFTHGKQWSFVAGIQSAFICLIHGLVTLGVLSFILN